MNPLAIHCYPEAVARGSAIGDLLKCLRRDGPHDEARDPALTAGLLLAFPALALDYDQDVTPDVIFGAGNTNGAFTVDVQSYVDYSIELGLRAKLRFDANNDPQNVYNSNGNGPSSFPAGAAPGGFSWQPNSPTTPVWNFEFAVNVNQTSLGIMTLDDFTYELGLDLDADLAASLYLSFDPITPTLGMPYFDHSIGDNTTDETNDLVAGDAVTYASYLAAYPVAQNSWNYEFFNEAPFDGFDPADDGVYQIYLKAFHGGAVVAHTEISVLVGGPVGTESTSWGRVKSLFR